MRQEEKRNRHGYRDECDGLADTWSGFTRPDSVLVRPRISHATEMLSERIGIVSELGELADRNQLALLLMAHGVRVSGLFRLLNQQRIVTFDQGQDRLSLGR